MLRLFAGRMDRVYRRKTRMPFSRYAVTFVHFTHFPVPAAPPPAAFFIRQISAGLLRFRRKRGYIARLRMRPMSLYESGDSSG